MSRGAGKEGLSRRHRFAGRGAFLAALRGPRKFRGRTAILHVSSGALAQSRIGLSIAKRLARRSVDRNRMKRLAREVFRHHAVKGRGLDLVIALRQPLARGFDAGWVAEVESLLVQACDGR
jgi:ribonuclease P protein component